MNDTARAALADSANVVYLSAASAWEIAIKHALGRLRLPEPPVRDVPERLYANRMTGLPIGFEHALYVDTLPHHHRDPIDRLLVAQASLERLTLVSADPIFERYPVDLLWAG